jgi:hypothetical protein
MNEIKVKLNNIVDWLNKNYNQDSENYSIFNGAKPDVFRYDEHTAISLWSCGAIILIESILYFIEEDDGNWYLLESKRREKFEDYGYQDKKQEQMADKSIIYHLSFVI